MDICTYAGGLCVCVGGTSGPHHTVYQCLYIFMTLHSYIFVRFQKITFKYGGFTDFKAFFPVMLTVYCSLVIVKILKTTMEMSIRAIYLWPWNENAQTIQKQQKNGNRTNWLVYWTDTNAGGFWLVKGTLGWKNFMPKNLLEIKRYFAVMSYCNMIGQSNNALSIMILGWKRRGPVLIFSSIDC